MGPNTIKEGDSNEFNVQIAEVQQSSQVTWSTFRPLRKIIQENKWKGVEDFVRDNPAALTDDISSNFKTIFHHIINYCREDEEGAACLIEKLASKVQSTTLERKDRSGITILAACAIRGNTRASKVLVKYNANLPNTLCGSVFPIHLAADFGQRDTVQYLIQVTAIKELYGESGAWLLSRLIRSNLYDIALDFLKRYPKLGHDEIYTRNMVLESLAQKPQAFASGSKLRCLKRFIYNCIPVNKENITDPTNKKQRVGGYVENLGLRSTNYPRKPLIFGSLPQITTTKFGSICQELQIMFWTALELLVPCIKVIREQKLTHMLTVEIVKMICEGVAWSDSGVFKRVGSLLTDESFGISEIANEIIMAYNEAIYFSNRAGHNLFQVAIIHRREKVFNLIYDTLFLNNMTTVLDTYGNNMLHLAAGVLTVPSGKVAGAALQMQRELQWFKAVENLLPLADREMKNVENQTPRQVFTETHKQLVKEGEKWMRDTATSCTVAVTLIITVVFAAAFTVPGGNNNGGVPNFLKDQAFLIFAVSDALALFSSTTSLLMFLGILTSLYEEEDFRVSLPRMLVIGLITLFFSIATVMVAFGATIYIVLSETWKWIIIPISFLGCVPVTLFALLQFPLLVHMFSSTYGPSIFGYMK